MKIIVLYAEGIWASEKKIEQKLQPASSSTDPNFVNWLQQLKSCSKRPMIDNGQIPLLRPGTGSCDFFCSKPRHRPCRSTSAADNLLTA